MAYLKSDRTPRTRAAGLTASTAPLHTSQRRQPWPPPRNDDDEMITGINVTPLVDITLVLLVILMVTASYVASKAIPLELPKGATAETTPTTLSVSIDKDGKTYLDAVPIDDAGAARRSARRARRRPGDAGGDRRRRADRRTRTWCT